MQDSRDRSPQQPSPPRAAPTWPVARAAAWLGSASHTLRFRLFVLAAAGLLPLVVMVSLSLSYLIDEREKATETSARELSRALGTAIEGELRSSLDTLRALAQDYQFQNGNFSEFRSRAVKLAELQGWRNIVLTDSAGQFVMRTRSPQPGRAQMPVDPDSVQEALSTQQPVVGYSVSVNAADPPAFAVRLPVTVKTEKYVLSAVIPAEEVYEILKQQAIPDSWVVSVLDRRYQRVARSPPTQAPGISPSLREILNKGASEGTGRNLTVEGRGTHVGYSRLSTSGWTVVVGIPFSQVTQATFRPLAGALAGLVASLMLSAYLAWVFGGKVIGPIVALKNGANALGHGEPVEIGPLEITEFDAVAQALEQASRDRRLFMQQLSTAQSEREVLLAQVTRGLTAAEEAGRAKDEFLAVLGHELRNPLAPISLALELMSRKGDASTANERTVIARQVRHMTRLVDDLLDLARITRKQLVMTLEPVRVLDAVRHVIDGMKPLLGSKTLSTDFSEAADSAWVLGDEARLNQVLTNLLVNACKFTGPSGAIGVTVSLEAGIVGIVIEDNGRGISPDVLQHVFEPFFQHQQASDRSAGGLGLGLAIVKSIVEMHEGSVLAQSAGEGRGARFVVHLPATARQELPFQVLAAADDSANGKILVLDDKKDAADLTAAFLESAGYEVRVCYHPDDALALLDEFEPSVAVLDIGLPDMSGYELAKQWRQHPGGRHCGLIALTGYARANDVEKAFASGFDVHLAKPAAPDDLLDHVGRLMALHRERKSAGAEQDSNVS